MEQIKIRNAAIECDCDCDNCQHIEYEDIIIDNSCNIVTHGFCDIREDTVFDFVYLNIKPIFDRVESLSDKGEVDYYEIVEKNREDEDILSLSQKLSKEDYFKNYSSGELLSISHSYIKNCAMCNDLKNKIYEIK